MVVETWLLKMTSQVSANFKHALLLENSKKASTKKQQVKETIGILCFEVANLMSKTVFLHKSLADKEISKLKCELLNRQGIKTLVSCDEAYIIELALCEKMEELNSLAGVVSRLGKKCTLPALQGFEHVYGDIVSGVIEVKDLGFLVKDMEAMVRKMERFVNLTGALYGEIAVLRELEITTKKFQQSHLEETRKAFEQKLMWQEQDVKHLKDVSLWNQSYDKVVELLARTVCTLYVRICNVFGSKSGKGNGSLDHLKADSGVKLGQVNVKLENSVPIRRGLRKKNGGDKSGLTEKHRTEKRKSNVRPKIEAQQFRAEDLDMLCGMGPGRLFKECLSLSSSGTKVDDDSECNGLEDRSKPIGCCSVVSGEKRNNVERSGGVASSQTSSSFTFSAVNCSRSSLKSSFMAYATPSTIGGSGLALRYANVVIIIEKLLMYPHLVGEEARDDLYFLLPTNLRMSLKTSLKSFKEDLAIYDSSLAHDWRGRLDQILQWLAPLAHNMIRWLNERNIEQQQIVKRTNVLLLQTLYFADRVKTEEVLCEVLIGLNYICRYEHQLDALLDCSSSFDLDDCVGEPY
ncbi:Mitochondrial group I intron splicing factor like [Heracleum sosnowskyi]|uniref:Mitochondrial group I intron splicing factor like n=1 Tax=Heracleum sosnowskyi TaxID=360622 RepID=A0AAD8I7F8_9APIA|nr:Mitochondrial group I intron splicing factor like [Heracleum sosnowskyi]